MLLGYDLDGDRAAIVERAVKLEGHIVLLSSEPEVNQKIAKELDKAFPFNASPWFSCVTPREVIRIFVAVDREASLFQKDGYREALYANQYFHALMRKLEVKSSDFSHIHIDANPNGTAFPMQLQTYRDNLNPIMYIGQHLQKFKESINPEAGGLLAKMTLISDIIKASDMHAVRKMVT